jgi:ubiquinone/menaquinone biosynthesis C-methylase UbiE
MRRLGELLDGIISEPWAFDWAQHLLGLQEQRRRLAPLLVHTDGQIVLDIGAGTGNYAPLLPDSAKHVGLDIDRKKLQSFMTKGSTRVGLVGDATSICLRDKSVDCALCIALSHHLSDSQMPLVFKELARVVRDRLVFMDAVMDSDSTLSQLLWKCDRGKYPRSIQALHAALQPWFELEQVHEFAVFHRYMMCLGRPRVGT